MTVGRRKRRKSTNKLAYLSIIGVVLLLIGILSFQTYNLKAELAAREAEKESVSQALLDEEERTAQLEEYKIYVQTKQYIEEMAKTKLGLVYQDEILIKPNN